MKECPTCKYCYEDNLTQCPQDQVELVFSLPGELLVDSKYKIICCIGRGGMGSVYKAEHIYLGKIFAIKTVSPDFVNRDPSCVDRFRQEARASAAIHHPNVVATTDFGITKQGVLYLVMEYMEGRGLQEIISVAGPLFPERVLKIMKQVCAGVGAAHGLSLIHRDLKPSNIMIGRSLLAPIPLNEMGIVFGERSSSSLQSKDPDLETEIVKILDFGLAKVLNSEILGEGPATLGTGVMGTPYYMSPEQCSGKPIDLRSDIYSLGIVLFQMLTKQVPFKGDSFGAIVSAHLMKPPPKLRSINSNISDALENVVLRALAKEPANRQQSTDQLYDELESSIIKSSVSKFNTAELLVKSHPVNCEIYIDEMLCGNTGSNGQFSLKLSSGEHNLRISCPGWFDNTFTIQMENVNQTIEIKLCPRTILGHQDSTKQLPLTRLDVSDPFNKIGIKTSKSFSITNSGMSKYVSPKSFSSEINKKNDSLTIDILLSILCATFVLTVFSVLVPFPDPLSEFIGKTLPFIPSLVGFSGILSTLVAIFTLLITDYKYSYKATPVLAQIFGISRTLFASTIILTTIIAALGGAIGSWDMPSYTWFMLRLGLIMTFSTLYARVRKRHRASIV